ncbi:hypothetical protein T11_13042 [Trichinella zimbabwensis]|uniref:Uncharacterized protein n=1 Tax=Trichinella zimbabwensis TaxID=268475 RepID=A0A0V1GN14_9BILA|nr:hypothetical protein T11_13042 [Trichinella zimbabwensis]
MSMSDSYECYAKPFLINLSEDGSKLAEMGKNSSA